MQITTEVSYDTVRDKPISNLHGTIFVSMTYFYVFIKVLMNQKQTEQFNRVILKKQLIIKKREVDFRFYYNAVEIKAYYEKEIS